MSDAMRQRVYEANMLLPKYGLVTFTWGNVSEIDREAGLIYIKPSGVAYETMKPEDIVAVDMNGKPVEGSLRPSSDTPTHLALYKAFPALGGIVHTHSEWAVAWAQAGRSIPCNGTTHADYFYGEIPCVRALTEEEVEGDYEYNTGRVIGDWFRENGIDPVAVPGVLCRNHGPFSWGKDAQEAVHNAVVLETVAKMALLSKLVDPQIGAAPQYLQDKHYFRKHGAGAYYGQK